MIKRSHSPEETAKIAEEFVRDLAPRERAVVVGLSGELGAGKTTFVQAVGKALGVSERLQSPTFVIEKIYRLEEQQFERLIHIDAYRIESEHEIEVLGWRDVVADKNNLIVVEWAERIKNVLPKDAIKLFFESVGEHERVISGAELK